MPVITFWSELKKETGQTTTAIALAIQLAFAHNKKTLLLTTQNNNEIESAFWDDTKRKKNTLAFLGERREINMESGISGIEKAITSHKLTPELIKNYTKIVFKENRLELISGLNRDETEYMRLKQIYPQLIQLAIQFYDYVIIDLNKGYDLFTKTIIDLSDVIVYSINQKNNDINHYVESKTRGFISKSNKVVPVLGRYDRFSKYTSKNISRLLKERIELDAVPYNTLFAEACDEGQAANYFFKMSTVSDSDRNKIFLKQIAKLEQSILFKIDELQRKM